MDYRPDEFSFKELYDFTIKATYPIEVGPRTIQKGETIALFDKIQLANFNEVAGFVAARGGYGNRIWVTWNDSQGIKLHFTQGIFNSTQLAILSNSRLLEQKEHQGVLISKRIELESDENGEMTLPEGINDIFIYKKSDGTKVELTIVDNTVSGLESYTDYVIDYTYVYGGKGETQVVLLGQRLFNGWLYAEGKTKLKDDVTGLVRTGILRIPRMKLMSDLTMAIGKNANPALGSLDALATPYGMKGNLASMNFYLLEDDIDSDM